MLAPTRDPTLCGAEALGHWSAAGVGGGMEANDPRQTGNTEI